MTVLSPLDAIAAWEERRGVAAERLASARLALHNAKQRRDELTRERDAEIRRAAPAGEDPHIDAIEAELVEIERAIGDPGARDVPGRPGRAPKPGRLMVAVRACESQLASIDAERSALIEAVRPVRVAGARERSRQATRIRHELAELVREYIAIETAIEAEWTATFEGQLKPGEATPNGQRDDLQERVRALFDSDPRRPGHSPLDLLWLPEPDFRAVDGAHWRARPVLTAVADYLESGDCFPRAFPDVLPADQGQPGSYVDMVSGERLVISPQRAQELRAALLPDDLGAVRYVYERPLSEGELDDIRLRLVNKQPGERGRVVSGWDGESVPDIDPFEAARGVELDAPDPTAPEPFMEVFG